MQMDDDNYTHVEITTTSGAADLYIKKGNPGGPTQEPTEEPDQKELLTPFNDGWNTPAGATVSADEVSVDVPAKTGGDNWSTQLVKNGLKLTNGKWYKATVTINSSVARKFQLLIQSDGQQGGNWSLMNPDNNLFEVEANVDKTFTYTFQASNVANNYLFGVMMGWVDQTDSDACTVKVTNASLIQYKDEPVEPTTEAPTVEPTTEAPTEAPTVAPTEEPTEAPTEAPTVAPKPQDYYDAWVDTDRNLAISGTPSYTGKWREGSQEAMNDAEIGLWNNWAAITVDNGNPTGSFDIVLDKAYDAASIDQVVVYWRTADVQFVPQSGYKVQFGYKGTFYDVDTVAKADYPTEGTTGGWVDAARFVTDSDFTASRLESRGVDTVRIYIDTTVEWGAQIRELCVFAENPQDAPSLPQADAPAAVTASSPDYGQIAFNVTAGEGQEGYVYNVYANDALIGEGVNAGQDYVAYGCNPGEYSIKAVSIAEGMDPSDPVFTDEPVTVADPIELFASTKNKAPLGLVTAVSSFYNDTYDIATSQCAIDGTPQAGEGNTVCIRTGAGVTATIDIDLQEEYNIKDLDKILLAYTNPRTYAASTQIGISADGETYTEAASGQGFIPDKDGQLSINMIDSEVKDAEGTFRYVRINLSGGVNNWGYCVNQIGIIVDESVEPTTEAPTAEPTEEPTVEPSTEAPTVEPSTEAPGEDWIALGNGTPDPAGANFYYDKNSCTDKLVVNNVQMRGDNMVVHMYNQVAAIKQLKVNGEDSSSEFEGAGAFVLASELSLNINTVEMTDVDGNKYSVRIKNNNITPEPSTEAPTVEPSSEEPSSEEPTEEPSTEAPTGSGYDMHQLGYDAWTQIGGEFYGYTGSGNGANVEVGYKSDDSTAKFTQVSGGQWWEWGTQIAAVYPNLTDEVKAGKKYDITWTVHTENGVSGNVLKATGYEQNIDFSSGEVTLTGTLVYNEYIDAAAWCIGTMWVPEGVSVIFDKPVISGDEPTTEAPTVEPSTEAPTVEPSTEAPTVEPSTEAPTVEPSTQAPTQKPTQAPTVKPTIPQPIPVIKVPDKAKVKKAVKKKKSAKKIKVKLKKVKGAKGYQVYVSKKKKGKALVKKYTTKTKLTIKSKKFKKKKKLYVKVRAYVLDGTTKVFGAWSKPKKTKKK